MTEQTSTPVASAQLQAAAQALEAGDAKRAERPLAALAATCPRHPEVLRLQAIWYDLRGMRREAMTIMQRALALRPGDAIYHNTMGTMVGNAGDLDAATASFTRACELQPELAIAWYNLGVMQARRGHHDEAIVTLRHAAALDPSHAAARTRLADVLRDHGDAQAAEREYRKILQAQPATGVAWWGLADLKTIPMAEADIEQMTTLLADPGVNDDARVAIGFALAKALEDNGRYEDSIKALAVAKEISRRRQSWDAASYSRGISALNAAFAPPPAGAVTPGLGSGIIFIVGLPRSGSTLVEQILSSHPDVEGAGELHDLKCVLIEESQRRHAPYPAWVHAMHPADWDRLGRRYLERTQAWRSRRPVSTDKLPNNWMFIGAIAAMLPGSHVVCCRRDPLETCFSCYRQYRNHHDYTDTFRDLGSFWRDFDRSMQFWHNQYPDRIHDHQYEELLSDPETSIRKLLAFCRLPPSANCLQFHQNRRDVHTPSATQVRVPLHSDTARAPRYGSLLDPLRRELGLPAFPGNTA